MTNWLVKFFILSGPPSTQAEKLVGFLWSNATRSTVILLAGFVLSLVWARSSAAARHLIWVCVFSSLLVLPALSLVVPAWRLPSSVMSQAGAEEIVGPSRTTAPGPDFRPLHGAVIPAKNQETKSGLPIFDPYVIALCVWVVGFAVVLGRLFLGSARVGRMAKRAKPMASADWTSLLQRIAAEFHLKRAVALVQSDEAIMPMAWELLRPVILLPRNAGQWSIDRRAIVIAHELAHVQRQDCLTLFLAQTACAVYWFNPLVWLAARRLRRESEGASDDRVISMGTKPCDYAGHLLDLARSLRAPKASWAAAVAMANPSQLEGPILAMLDPRRHRGTATARRAMLTALCFAVFVLPIAGLRGAPGAESGKISGQILDPSGAVVPGAIVIATNVETKKQHAIITGADGQFEFPAIPAGKYLVDISKPGFGISPGNNLEVKPKGEIKLVATLSIGLMVQNVDVVAKGRRKNSASPKLPSRRIHVGGDMQAANLLAQVEPVYPAEALDRGIEGTVLLNAVISMEGDVLSAEVTNSPDPDLAKAALDAVKQWRYRPALLNGDPIEVVTTITVRFKLEE